jgi:DNA-binding transcriptional regulator/RsmH inhibitor MraZ
LFSGIFFTAKANDSITIPEEWADNFKDDRAIMGLFPEGCIFVFPLKDWLRLKPGKGLSLAGREDRKNLRVIFSRAKEKKIEKGIIDVSEFTDSISDSVLLAGCGNYFEIWRKDDFEKELEKNIKRMASKNFLE